MNVRLKFGYCWWIYVVLYTLGFKHLKFQQQSFKTENITLIIRSAHTETLLLLIIKKYIEHIKQSMSLSPDINTPNIYYQT